MPHLHEHEGAKILIPRMTEIISVLECEARSALHPVNSKAHSWKSVSNYVALAGTLGHLKVENFIRELIDFPTEEMNLSEADQKLYDEIQSNPKSKDWLQEYIDTAFNNYLEFHEDFQPTYLHPEITMIYLHDENGAIEPKKSIKGTIDLICELDPEKMSKKALKIVPIEEKSTILLDWKTGMAKLSGHHYQLEGYRWLIRASGTLAKLISKGTVQRPFAKVDGVELALCVRLGGSFGYMADAYKMNSGKFDEAREIFANPSLLVKTQNEKYGDRYFREGYHCVFCPYRDAGCPIFNVQTVQLEELI